MLKSLSTQFAATLFFGPLGLAYSSLAGAVLLTLLFAVLYFTALGLTAVVLIWPIAIVAGLVLVKLQNDQIRASGSTLLLGPGEEERTVGTISSWGRGIAVLSLMGVVGYLALWYSPSGTSEKIGRMVDVSPVENAIANNNYPVDSDLTGSVSDSDAAVDTVSFDDDIAGSSDITTDRQAITPEIINSSFDSSVLYVNSAVVNLRGGPGTNYKVLRQVERGDELKEVDRAGNWISVVTTDDDTSGWILGRLVTTQR